MLMSHFLPVAPHVVQKLGVATHLHYLNINVLPTFNQNQQSPCTPCVAHFIWGVNEGSTPLLLTLSRHEASRGITGGPAACGAYLLP
jgi:hypothetical protein